ncbi:MAG: hypothetical protein Kow00117_21580 [Phototrophicales bacterium]|nr:MAG: hypothetical protein CUN56_00315 [Phototrophicales bacterium]RMG71125.1 MAG: hypothetical protein D6711_16010 [Chloroflexota bacterium]
MDIHLNLKLNLQLQEIAKQQGREISEILIDAIAEYVERNTQEQAFRAKVENTIATHRWLLNELAER